MKKLTYEQAKRWVLQHGKEMKGQPGYLEDEGVFVKLTEPLPFFKRAVDHMCNNVVINLKAPKGALVFVGRPERWTASTHYKIRVSKAHVHSIIYNKGKVRWAMLEAESRTRSDFKYRTGKTVTPDRFDKRYRTCAAGIHGFADITSTLRYQFD